MPTPTAMTLAEELFAKYGWEDCDEVNGDLVSRENFAVAIDEALERAAQLADDYDDAQADAECMCCLGDKIRALKSPAPGGPDGPA